VLLVFCEFQLDEGALLRVSELFPGQIDGKERG